MLKTILIWGAIAGLIMTGVFFIGLNGAEGEEVNFTSGEIIGYASFVLAFGAGYFGVRQLRDRSNNWGFGSAFGASMGIVLVGGLIYSISWTVYAQNNPDEVEAMMEAYFEQVAEKQGLSEEEAAEKRAEGEQYLEMMKNPVTNTIMTFLMEPLPTGLLISLIIGVLLRKGKKSVTDEIIDTRV